jgi:hypothetical protein
MSARRLSVCVSVSGRRGVAAVRLLREFDVNSVTKLKCETTVQRE